MAGGNNHHDEFSDALHKAAREIIAHPGDVRNSRWFAALHSDKVRYFSVRRTWLIYDGKRWREDDQHYITKLAKEAADVMLKYAAKMEADGKAKLRAEADRLQYRPKLDNMIALSQSDVPVTADELNTDPWLFNVDNGTINLETCELRSHEPADLLTKLAHVAFDPAATCPNWDRFVRVVLPDPDTASFVQRFAGYCLTGHTREQVMAVFVGDGANGKTTLINALFDVLGLDYGMRAARDLMMAERRDGHPTCYADLFGKRMVTVSETADGGCLDESFVKDLTGSDRIRTRFMYKDHFEFLPTHKFVVATNHMPRINWSDHGMSRRLRVVPFKTRFWNPDAGDTGPPELRQDKLLSERLSAEASGILNWLIRGCLEWQRQDGLPASKQMLAAAAGHKAASASVERFMNDCCELSETGRIGATVLYRAYTRFAARVNPGHPPESSSRLGTELRRLGYQKRHTRTGVVYEGVSLTQGILQND